MSYSSREQGVQGDLESEGLSGKIPGRSEMRTRGGVGKRRPSTVTGEASEAQDSVLIGYIGFWLTSVIMDGMGGKLSV